MANVGQYLAGRLDTSGSLQQSTIIAPQRTAVMPQSTVVREVPGKQVVERHTVIQYKPEIVEREKVVEIPQVNLHYIEEEVPQFIRREMLVELEQEQQYEAVEQQGIVIYEEVVKNIPKYLYEAREHIVEVPHVLHKEIIVEVPQVQIVELVRQVPREQRQRQIVHVEKPVVQFRDKFVDVPSVTTKEQIVEVPRIEEVEIIRQVPGPHETQTVERQVEKHINEYIEAMEEVPFIEIEEQIIEVPQIEIREVVKQVSRVEVQYIDKHVKKVEIEYVEKIVEIPHVIYEERIIEVPQIEVREVVRRVPKAVVHYIDKHVPKQELRYYEKVVETPLMLEQDQLFEVPTISVVEVETQRPKPVTNFVDKEVQKVSIQAVEVHQEVDVNLQHEQALEIAQAFAVDVVQQVTAPYTEYRDKNVPNVETQVQERLQQVTQHLTRERLVEVPQIQYVDLVNEEPRYDVREVLKEVPRYTVNYRHIEEQVNQEFVGDGSHQHTRSVFIEREPPNIITASMPSSQVYVQQVPARRSSIVAAPMVEQGAAGASSGKFGSILFGGEGLRAFAVVVHPGAAQVGVPTQNIDAPTGERVQTVRILGEGGQVFDAMVASPADAIGVAVESLAPVKSIRTMPTAVGNRPVQVVTLLDDQNQPVQAVVSNLPPPASQPGAPLIYIPCLTVLGEDGDPVQVVTILLDDGQQVQAALAQPGVPVKSIPGFPVNSVPSHTMALEDGQVCQVVTVIGQDGQPAAAVVTQSTAAPIASSALIASQHWAPVASMPAAPLASMMQQGLPVTSVPAETVVDENGNHHEVITIFNNQGVPIQAVLAQPGAPVNSRPMGLPVIPTQSIVLNEGGVPVMVVTVLGEGDVPLQAVVTKDGNPLTATPGAPIMSMRSGFVAPVTTMRSAMVSGLVPVPSQPQAQYVYPATSHSATTYPASAHSATTVVAPPQYVTTSTASYQPARAAPVIVAAPMVEPIPGQVARPGVTIQSMPITGGGATAVAVVSQAGQPRVSVPVETVDTIHGDRVKTITILGEGGVCLQAVVSDMPSQPAGAAVSIASMAPSTRIPTSSARVPAAGNALVQVVTVLGEGGQPVQAIVSQSPVATVPYHQRPGMPVVSIPAMTVLGDDGHPVQVVTALDANGQPIQAALARPGAPVRSIAGQPVASLPTQTVIAEDGHPVMVLTMLGDDGIPVQAVITQSVNPLQSQGPGTLVSSHAWAPVASVPLGPQHPSSAMPVTSVAAETVVDENGNHMEVITIMGQGNEPIHAILSQPGRPVARHTGMPVVPTSFVVGEGGIPIQVVTLVGERGQQMQAVVTKDGVPMMAQPGAPIQSMAFGQRPATTAPVSMPIGTFPGTIINYPSQPQMMQEPVATGMGGAPQPVYSMHAQQYGQQYVVPGQPVPSRTMAVTPVVPQQPPVFVGGRAVRPVSTAPGQTVIMPYGGSPVGTTVSPVPTSTGLVRTGGYQVMAQPFHGQPVLTQPFHGQPVITQPFGGPSGSGALGAGALPMRVGLLKAGSITDDVFNMVDRNHDGVISRSEFRGALKGNIISATSNTRAALGR